MILKDSRQSHDEKCATRQSVNGQERSAQKDVKENDNVIKDDFEQLVEELEKVEREAGLQDAFLFLKFDTYFNSWNNSPK